MSSCLSAANTSLTLSGNVQEQLCFTVYTGLTLSVNVHEQLSFYCSDWSDII